MNLELWDVPGTLDPNLEDIYFKDVDGVILVFDVGNAKQSTEDVAKWFDRVVAYEQRVGIGPLPKIKLGNKRDLIHGVLWHNYDTSKAPPRKGRRAKFAAFATCPSFTVSAKDFGGLHSAFKQVIAEIYNDKHSLGGATSAAAAATPAERLEPQDDNANRASSDSQDQSEARDRSQPDNIDAEHEQSEPEKSEAPEAANASAQGDDDDGSVESKSDSTAAAAGQAL